MRHTKLHALELGARDFLLERKNENIEEVESESDFGIVVGRVLGKPHTAIERGIIDSRRLSQLRLRDAYLLEAREKRTIVQKRDTNSRVDVQGFYQELMDELSDRSIVFGVARPFRRVTGAGANTLAHVVERRSRIGARASAQPGEAGEAGEGRHPEKRDGERPSKAAFSGAHGVGSFLRTRLIPQSWHWLPSGPVTSGCIGQA